MQLFTTLDMIGDYFTKEIKGYQLRCFYNIILGIYEYDITSYNAPGRAFFEERNIKLYKDKQESHKADKPAGK